MRRLASLLAPDKALALMKRSISLEIWQREVGLAIPAVGRAQQREERLVLVDRQLLSVAERPALRGEVEAHDFDFAKEWFSHDVSAG